ncbi:POP1-domain-containing protein [Obba rivulosa]|uniref:POP1-domain-containing protein n=1 Tax=Obba rivulosa TaxID=1052685 RepID=A0A8E2AJN1_9APHY|nr:POP1-domain-containing protein [Obba rivulosa]
MPPKRKADGNDGPTGREKKKQRAEIARTIAVQAGPSGASSNAVAGPSGSVRFDSMKGLPGSLDVERFAESRAFEIKSMHEGMKNARASATQRAWQQLPRHLRRRAASHDVRRVPLRLREKARAEMDPMRRKALGRPKLGKAKRQNRTQQLLKRQRDKTWLETHLWHAKRMKMDNMWGYRLAMEPTEKSFRASHRASVHGSILHDASYYGIIELRGPEKVLRDIFDRCCDKQGSSAGAKRYLTGKIICETHIYERDSYPLGLIAPATAMWQPVASTSTTTESEAPSEPTVNVTTGSIEGNANAKKKGKGKEKGTLDSETLRVAWVRVHPSVFSEVFILLRNAASFALEAARNSDSSKVYEVEIADLRQQINIFEIMGPKSSQIIKGALKPIPDDRPQFKEFWESLSKLQSPGSVPSGMIIGFTVYDPRLNFPPKNAKLQIDSDALPHLPAASHVFPSIELAKSEIWQENVRKALQRPHYKKKELDQRRSNNLVPGTSLQALRQDDRVPVLLIQRTVSGSSADSASALHGWTLIVPSGWGMPFFSSLTHTGTRVGGQRERQTQAFEAGCVCFPRDYPSTQPYDEYVEERAEDERDKWERTPPAKRVNYSKLGTRSPWTPDWEVVLGIASARAAEAEGGDGGDLIDTQRDGPPTSTAVALNSEKASVRPWLLRGPDVQMILDKVSTMFHPGAGLLDFINERRLKRDEAPLSVRADELWKSALVSIRVTPRGRGSPEDLTIIYSVTDEEACQWIKTEAQRKKGALLEDTEDEIELSKRLPSQEAIIGYVTSGNYSLSRGTGHGIGAIPVARWFELRQQAQRLKQGYLLVKIRNRGDPICRAASLEVLQG